MLSAIFYVMTGAVSSKRYSKPVKIFIVQMSRRIDTQWIKRTIKVVSEPTFPFFRPSARGR
jgi:coenzyme F420-reducing hydrogenase delta subunit